MMIVVLLLILVTLVLRFYSVDQLTSDPVQWLSGVGGLAVMAGVAVLVIWLVWRKRRPGARPSAGLPPKS